MSEITKAIQSLCDEKNLSYEAVMETIEAALAAAYRKDFGNKQQNIKVKFDAETGDMEAWDVKTVVEDIDEETLEKAQEELAARRERAREEGRELTEEETADSPRFNPKTEMMITEAKTVKKNAKVGDILEMSLEIPHSFGRMAAQTAKQVIIQKVREAERNMVFGDFKTQEGQIIVGTIQRVEGRKVLIDLGKVTGIMPSDQAVYNEHYRSGARMKFYVVSVEMTTRGPEIILSRAHTGMVSAIFKQEIPELQDGKIEIKGIARDAGWRSKVAVVATDQQIDPIGSCIGQRGGRINTIIEELGGEKIDIVLWSDNQREYVINALSPAKIVDAELFEDERSATVTVAPEQYSLAIGRNGQNVRLASDLTGWRINVVQQGAVPVQAAKDESSEEEVKTEVEQPAEDDAAKQKEEKKTKKKAASKK